MPRMVDLASFECLNLTVKHDNFLIGQILVKNAKIQKIQMRHFG